MPEQASTALWGDFEVRFDQLLGRGGMGSVYRARQISLDRIVAVKVLEPHRAPTDEIAEGFIGKFDVEAKALAKLRDARIITILQAGRNDGKCWYAMELVEGETIDERITKSGMFEPREAARIAAEVARALAAALVQGIIHRDVKPANIFLTNAGAVKLGDFGLARSEEFKPTRFTEMNAVAATPEYASPEQAANGVCDHRSDQYSLGAVLFEMVTERPPFGGTSAIETFFKHAHEEVPQPSKLNPSIPPRLEATILRCLEKDPAKRFPNYDELIRELEAIAAPPTAKTPEPTPRLVDEKPRAAIGAGFLMAALVLIFAVLGIIHLASKPPQAAQPKVQAAAPPPPPRKEIVAVSPSPIPSTHPEDEALAKKREMERRIRTLRDSGKAMEALELMTREKLDVEGVVEAAKKEVWIAIDLPDPVRIKAYLELEPDADIQDELAALDAPLDHPMTRAFERAVRGIYEKRNHSPIALGEVKSWKQYPGSDRARWESRDGIRIHDPEKATWLSKTVGTNKGFTVRFRFKTEGASAWCGLAVTAMDPAGYRMVQVLSAGEKRVASLVTRKAGKVEGAGEFEVTTKDDYELSVVASEGRRFIFVDGRLAGFDREEAMPESVSVGVMRGEVLVTELLIAR